MTDFNGLLAAEVTATGVTLELPDLHGDIMATASTSSTATGPATTCIYNEFGVVESGSPGSYGWEGGNQISSNALGGQLLMGARAYNPSTGRFSQTDPIPGGSANAYDYSAQNPVTNSDLTGTRNRQGISCGVSFYGNSAAGTEFEGCTVGLNNYWTVQLVDSLNWAAAAGATCAGATWFIPGVNAVVTAVCALLSGLAWLGAASIGQVNDAGHNVGIYFQVWWERVWWWWFGRHWSGWWFDGGYFWHQ